VEPQRLQEDGMTRTRDWRGPTAAGLRLTGVVLVVVALVLAYANRAVFDAGAFAARASLALRDDRVAALLAERIADQAIARKPDLVALRPVVVAAARSVVQSQAFGSLFRTASQRAHALAFSKSAENIVLSLPDFAVLIESAVAQLQPAAAGRLPQTLSAQLGGDVQQAMGEPVLRVLQAANRLRGSLWLALFGGLACLVASVAVSTDRRRALLLTGLALAAAAGVVFAIPALLGALVTAHIADPALQGAARGVWVAFTVRLETWALVLAGMGLVLAAAASSLASRVEVAATLARAGAWLSRPAGHAAVECLRAAGLLGAGLLFVLFPAGVVRVLAAVAGAVAVFEGLRSLFALIAPQLDEAAARAQEVVADARRDVRANPALRYAATALLVVLALGAGTAWLASSGAVPPLAHVVDRCNGAVDLCDRPLDAVVFAGAHNAMSAADTPGWLFPNQEVGIAAQLQLGIRALLFDVHTGVPVAGRVKTVLDEEPASTAKFEEALGAEGLAAAMRIRDRLVGPPEGPRRPYLCHGFCEIGARPLTDGLRDIRDFLVLHPGEVLLLVVEDYVRPADLAAAFAESALMDFVYTGPAGPPWPSLRDLIARNERVVVLVENDPGEVPWLHAAYDVTEETPYHFRSPDEFSCRPNRGGTGRSFFLVNHWIDTTPAPKPSNAAIVNARDFLLARVRQCEAERGRRPTMLAVDFARTGDVIGAVAALNGVASIVAGGAGPE
jgi:hypothetical protein